MSSAERLLRPLAALLLACGAVLAGVQAHAGPVHCGDKPIRLAFYEYGNLYFVDKQQTQGIDKDVADELQRRSGCRFETQVLVRARIWADLASGDLDMGLSGIQTPERDKFAWFAPYAVAKNYALVRMGIANQTKTAGAFMQQAPLQFGVVRSIKHGVEQDKWLDEMRAARRVEESANIETLFKKLNEGRIDGLFVQPVVYRRFIAELGLQEQIAIHDWFPGDRGVVGGLILAKSRFSEAQARHWQSLVAGMRSDGTLKRIYQRYLPAGEAAALLDF